MIQLLKLIKILNSDASPSAVSSAISLALFIGLTPITSPHNLVVLLIVLLFRVHLGTFVLASLGFKLLGLAFESGIEQLGLALLQNPGLESVWTSLYNTQLGRLSFFNYTTTFGGLFISCSAFVPLWLINIYLIKQYREHILTWMKQNKLLQILKGTALIRLYNNSTGGQ